MNRFIAFAMFTLGVVCAHAATNDLVITSILKQGECVTLQWRSHANEFYTVYWTDRLEQPIFWRVAEVNVPSGGTNTIWFEGDCQQQMMMAGGGGSGGESLQAGELSLESLEEQAITALLVESMRTELAEKYGGESAPAYLYPPGHPKYSANPDAATLLAKANVTTVLEQGAEPASGTGGGSMALLSSAPTANRFYRVARTAVGSRVTGWGEGMGNMPTTLSNVFAVSAGCAANVSHSLALRADGTVTAWGANFHGQTNVPTDLANAVAVAAGGHHSFALLRDGSLRGWGYNGLGQLNVPAHATNLADVKAGCWHNIALRADGAVATWGYLYSDANNAALAVPAGLSNVTAVAAGAFHCMALKHDGTVASWGIAPPILAPYLPTNTPAGLSNVIAISAGQEHSQALLRDGRVVVWGNPNDPAVSTIPSALTNSGAGVAMIAAGWQYGMLVKSNATVLAWGTAGRTNPPTGLTNVWTVSAGSRHALALLTNGLPVITEDPKSQEIGAGTYATLNVVAEGSPPFAYQWEKGGVAISGATNVSLMFPSFQSADAGTYRVRVSNAAGTTLSAEASLLYVTRPVILSQSLPLFTNLLTGSNITLSVVATNNGSATMTNYWLKNGQPWIATTNSQRLLLWNLTNAGSYQVIVSNSAGTATSLTWTVNVIAQGQSVGWGYPAYGLGLSQTPETDLVAVAASVHDSMGLRENGTVVAWGFNTYGQTNIPAGLTNVTAIAAGVFHSIALRENGTVVAWGSNTYGQTNVPPSATNIIAVAGGDRHSLALRNTGRVLAWGDNTFGATNVPADLTNAVAVAAGSGFSLALLSNGTVRAWGTGNFPASPVAPPSGLSNVVAIAAGYTHALALKIDGTVTAFGPDLGYGETAVPSGLSNVLQIAAGYAFSLALKNDGTLVAWGNNDWNQTNVPAPLGSIKSIAAGIWHGLALVYNPLLNYPVNVPQDLLLIYNTNSADSAFVKDYYLAHRPMVGGANVLGIGCSTNEAIRPADYTNTIGAQVQGWLTANPTKRPSYIILFPDMPSQVNTNNVTGVCGWDPAHEGPTPSVQYRLHAETLDSWKPYVTSINMAETNACKAYIDKLAFFGSNYAPGRVYLNANAGGYANTQFLVDDAAGLPDVSYYVTNALTGLLQGGVSTANITYASRGQTHITQATNVAGYISWGVHGGLHPNYSTNGDIAFAGQSSWWIIQTIESFNGQRCDAPQGTFLKWFSADAFGGVNYSNTPIGAVTHVQEPFVSEVNESQPYFRFWALGRNFAICAWKSRRTDKFQAVGDPFVQR